MEIYGGDEGKKRRTGKMSSRIMDRKLASQGTYRGFNQWWVLRVRLMRGKSRRRRWEQHGERGFSVLLPSRKRIPVSGVSPAKHLALTAEKYGLIFFYFKLSR
ncbi:hypothetical protein DY000_02013901 [Brassica cretica]|uniref:AP2/ERF domain-containing protein n=1 Tax=Brassica cretica TaxID=69181 RepID=A0ABQ7D264_BRACR|nr:hypothetical protein DY000_02013901 [Brassica cretica]